MDTAETHHYSTNAAQARSVCLIATAKAACDQRLRDAVRELRAHGHHIKTRVTWDSADATHFAQEAAQAGVDTVVAAGGDGTLNCVINGLMHLEQELPAVGVVPLGTANDFATACQIPLEPQEALAHVFLSNPQPIDACRLNDQFFINVATGGFGTDATVETPSEVKKLLGSISYLLTGVRQMTDLQSYSATISGPHFAWRGDFYAIAIGNSRQAGGGFQVCPQALINDGLIDLMVVPDMPRSQLLTLLGDLRNGELAGDDQVIYAQLPWLEVHTTEELQINLDGEPQKGRDLRFEAVSGRIQFHLPSTAPNVKRATT